MAEPRLSVLVVEDDESTRALIADLLSAELGVAVRQACDGHAAIAAVTAAAPDLILLDLKMPGLDGFAVLEWLESSPRTAAVPVLALTASANADELQSVEQLCDGVVGKPFDLDALIGAVRPFVSGASAGADAGHRPGDRPCLTSRR
jgi:CheY-like chemotaxis protein